MTIVQNISLTMNHIATLLTHTPRRSHRVVVSLVVHCHVRGGVLRTSYRVGEYHPP